MAAVTLDLYGMRLTNITIYGVMTVLTYMCIFLLQYFILMLALVLVEVVAGIMAFVYSSQVGSENKLIQNIHNVYGTFDLTKIEKLLETKSIIIRVDSLLAATIVYILYSSSPPTPFPKKK